MSFFCHNWIEYCPHHPSHLEYSVCSLAPAVTGPALEPGADLGNALKERRQEKPGRKYPFRPQEALPQLS